MKQHLGDVLRCGLQSVIDNPEGCAGGIAYTRGTMACDASSLPVENSVSMGGDKCESVFGEI